MRLVICNMGYAGYSAACWRELAARPGIYLHVYTPETHYHYAPNVIDGLPVTVIPDSTFLRRGFSKDLANQVLAEWYLHQSHQDLSTRNDEYESQPADLSYGRRADARPLITFALHHHLTFSSTLGSPRP